MKDAKNNWYDVSYDIIVKDIETTRFIIFNGEWKKEDETTERNPNVRYLPELASTICFI